MKIAITGAQGVGKTTLAQQVIAARPDYILLPEAARLALEKGFKLDEKADVETELWIMAKQIELERSSDNWVADRCFIDILVYIHELFGQDPKSDFLIQLAEKITSDHARKYDLVLYVPAGEFTLPNDGVRNTDSAFQLRIDTAIKTWLTNKKIPFHKIIGDPESRLQQVKDLINQ